MDAVLTAHDNHAMWVYFEVYGDRVMLMPRIEIEVSLPFKLGSGGTNAATEYLTVCDRSCFQPSEVEEGGRPSRHTYCDAGRVSASRCARAACHETKTSGSCFSTTFASLPLRLHLLSILGVIARMTSWRSKSLD
jgi:hypothetical protein